MIDHQFDKDSERILIGISLDSCCIDILSDAQLIQNAINELEIPRCEAIWIRIGTIGTLPITIYSRQYDFTSIFIDGPDFTEQRSQSASFSIDKKLLLKILHKALICS